MLFNALSIVYPAGTRIASGHKTLEIRSWEPPTLPLRNLLIVENRRRLDHDGDTDPDGKAVAVIDIEEVRDWTEADAQKDGHTYVRGYFAWVISNVRPINDPMAAPAERLIYQVEIPGLEIKYELTPPFPRLPLLPGDLRIRLQLIARAAEESFHARFEFGRPRHAVVVSGRKL